MKNFFKYFYIIPTDLKGGFKMQINIPIGRRKKKETDMKFWEKLKKVFKRADDLRERIEDAIAAVLERASDSELLDKGQELILNAAIEVIESYASEKTGQKIDLPSDTKKSIVNGIVGGHNKLQKRVAAILRRK